MRCEICNDGKEFDGTAGLNRHIGRMHPDEDKFIRKVKRKYTGFVRALYRKLKKQNLPTEKIKWQIADYLVEKIQKDTQLMPYVQNMNRTVLSLVLYMAVNLIFRNISLGLV